MMITNCALGEQGTTEPLGLLDLDSAVAPWFAILPSLCIFDLAVYGSDPSAYGCDSSVYPRGRFGRVCVRFERNIELGGYTVIRSSVSQFNQKRRWAQAGGLTHGGSLMSSII
jgi:hypothetical protein